MPPIFAELVRRGADEKRMFETFNMGIGFVLAVKKSDACAIVDRFNKHAKRFSVKGIPDMKAYTIGRVAASEKKIRGNVKGNKAMTLFEG